MWSSYFFAQQAAESLGVVSRVKLIDSGVFGLGFQHFFDRVVAYFEEGNPVVSLDSQCAGWAQKISSFVALEDTRIIQQSPLFDSLKFKQKSGVLSCSVPLSVLSSSDEFGDCVSSLVMHISEKLAASFDHTIQVVYHGCEAEVLQARDSLLTFFPSANVIVIKANPILVSYFGVFFGVSFVDM
jgi:fatty acid-binding protein DegV